MSELEKKKIKSDFAQIKFLEKDFWTCYQTGDFIQYNYELKKDLELFESKIQSLAYSKSYLFPDDYKLTEEAIYKSYPKYIINVLVLKNVFFVSIHRDIKNFSLISYLFSDNLKKEMESSNFQSKINPIGVEIFNKIKLELKNNGITFKHIYKRKINTKRCLKHIVGSILWNNLIEENSSLDVSEKIRLISEEVQLSESSVELIGATSFYDNVRKEAIKFRYDKCLSRREDNLRKRLNSKEFIESKRIILKKTICPADFWLAVKKGKIPKENSDNNSYHIEKYGEILEGKAYVNSIYLYYYIINFIAVKDIFYISIHSRKGSPYLLGNIDYNLYRGFDSRRKMSYAQKGMNENLVALELLRKVRRECVEEGFELDISIQRSPTNLAFERSINLIAVSVLWKETLDNWSPGREYNYETMADVVAHQINKFEIDSEKHISPITVAGYGSFSPDHDVRSKSILACKKLEAQLHDIEKKWKKLIIENLKRPANEQITLKERVNAISEELSLSPLYVANLGSSCDDLEVRTEAFEVSLELGNEAYQIPEKLAEYRSKFPLLGITGIVEKMAEELDLSPFTITFYLSKIVENRVKKKLQKYRMEKIFEINNLAERWRILSDLDPFTKVEIISDELKIKQKTIALYLREKYSEAEKVHRSYLDQKYGLSGELLRLLRERPSLTEKEQFKIIARSVNLNWQNVAKILRYNYLLNQPKKCKGCGKIIILRAKSAKFCSVKCQKHFWHFHHSNTEISTNSS